MERYLQKRLGSSKFENVDEVRSRTMSSIRGKGNKSTELALRMALVRAGISGWKMHPSHLKGKPDFFFPQQKVAIFVDGCFWHGCPVCGHTPSTRKRFWTAKLRRNRERDIAVVAALTSSGLIVLRIWEHELKSATGKARAAANITGVLNVEAIQRHNLPGIGDTISNATHSSHAPVDSRLSPH